MGPDPLFQRTPVRNFRADITLAGESGATLKALRRTMAAAADGNAPRRIAERRRRLAPVLAGLGEQRRAAGEVAAPLSKAAVAAILSEAVAEADPVVFSELGCPLDQLDLAHHDAWHQEPHAGGLGWSFPAAMGFKLAAPERLVVATMGDGSFVFANPVACFQLAEALGLPVLILVLNNAEWAAVRHSVAGLYPQGRAAMANSMPLTSLAPSPDFAGIARASRAWAEEANDAAGLQKALTAALAHVRSARTPALIDVRIVEAADMR